jgi:hypothetical protein
MWPNAAIDGSKCEQALSIWQEVKAIGRELRLGPSRLAPAPRGTIKSHLRYVIIYGEA